MIFRYSLRVFTSNFVSTWKMLVYKLIIALLVVAFGAAILLSNLLPLIEQIKATEFFKLIENFFRDLSVMDVNFPQYSTDFAAAFSGIGVVFAENAARFTSTFLATLFLVVLWQFLNGISFIALGDVVSGATALKAKLSFSSSLIRKLGKCIKFSLVRLITIFPIDLIIICLAVLFFVLLKSTFIMPFVLFLFIIVAVSFRISLFSLWVPYIVDKNMGTFKALRLAVKGVFTRFGKTISTVIVLLITTIIVNILIGLLTCGAGLILSLPATSVLFMSFSFVNYYGVVAKRYYADQDTIITPKSLQDKEKYNIDLI